MHLCARSFINTVASARWQDARSARELFQQFFSPGLKPLKRLTGCPATLHRAEATVLMGSPCGEGENWRALRCSAPPGRSEFHEPIRLAAKKRKRRKRNEDLSFSCQGQFMKRRQSRGSAAFMPFQLTARQAFWGNPALGDSEWRSGMNAALLPLHKLALLSCAFCASSRLFPTFAIGSQLSFFQ